MQLLRQMLQLLRQLLQLLQWSGKAGDRPRYLLLHLLQLLQRQQCYWRQLLQRELLLLLPMYLLELLLLLLPLYLV